MTTTPDPQIAADAQATKDVLLARGWTTGRLEAPATRTWYGRLRPGPVCLLGAVHLAIVGDVRLAIYGNPRTTALSDAITAHNQFRYRPMAFNDHGAGGLGAVLDVLDKVIETHTPELFTPAEPAPTQRDMELAAGPGDG